MNTETLIAFIVASAVITLIPGPCILLLIGQSMSKGIKAAFASVVGILLGDIFLILLSLLGVGTILVASPILFQIVKWSGAFYMAYLGYLSIANAKKSTLNTNNESYSSELLKSFTAGFLSAALNPKSIVFYMAFLSQFINPNVSTLMQINILVLTSTIVVGAILTMYVLLAVRAQMLLRSSIAKERINYIGGGSLILGSIVISVVR